MPKISIARLVEDNGTKLKLSWVNNHDSPALLDSVAIAASPKGLIGHLNFIHPNWIQILGSQETDYVNALDDETRRQALAGLIDSGPACIVCAAGQTPPAPLLAACREHRIPLLSSPLPSLEVMGILRYYLARLLAEPVSMHGVFLDVLGMGVLITGDAGAGKSELALELISRGHGLIADDIVELYRIAPDTLEGRCPPMLKDFLEVRGLGVLNIRTIFGETAIRPKKNLKLVVNLEKPGGNLSLERLPLNASVLEIAGVEIRKVTIPVAAGRNLAVLVEAAVRNFVLQLRGIDSTQEFIDRHHQHMNNNGN
ncbi:MAG: HPr(Ser) kinase/phosphatase [Pseudomonadota bacterium]